MEKKQVELNRKTILVTGSPGFIGANLVIRLLTTLTAGTVVSLDNMNDYYEVSLKEWRLEQINAVASTSSVKHIFIKGSIGDKALIDALFQQYQFDIVVNLAAQAGVRYSIDHPDVYIESNIIGFYNLQNFPKPLLKVGEKTIFDWLVDDVAELIDEFVIVSNHKFAEQFKEWSQRKPQKIRVIDDGTESNETRLGAVKDIQLAAEGLMDDCLVMAGDNVLDFSLQHFIRFAQEKGTSCVMCHEESRLFALQKTAVITTDENHLITSYEEKPKEPKDHLAVPPFYFYRVADIHRIQEALDAGCGYDAPGSFAAWLSGQTPMHAYVMPGKRYDIGDMKSYETVQAVYTGINL